MNANKQLVNLLGIVVTLAIVVAGVLLIALPMYTQSQTTDDQTRNVTQTNGVYEIQVAQLSAANDRIDEIDAELAQLRTQISAQTKFDDVFEIINDAVEKTDAVVESIAMTEPEPFIVRDPRVDAGRIGLPAADPEAAAAAAAPAAADATATDAAAAGDGATTDAATPAPATAAPRTRPSSRRSSPSR